MKRVLVLGGSGMLGSMVVDVLSRVEDFDVTATVRSSTGGIGDRYSNAAWRLFDVAAPDWSILEGQDWVVNAIGITKPLIKDDNAQQIERAIEVNARFPHELARRASRVLQIATDCVYSGLRGQYVETDHHDSLDVYGKTKSLGETFYLNVHHLRCSIIGPEPKEFKFLIEWFRRQPQNAKVNGFSNHFWNGVTTLHFAYLCRGIISSALSLPHMQHVIPDGRITKAALLREFATAYNRTDIQINDIDAGVLVDRTLATANLSLNQSIWAAAGYVTPPSVPQMIQELAVFDYRASGATV